ncbi:MAG: phosphatase PAP2 family protein [Clostridia bacterium]|nr:phosphatase PAP2 family protein [Clostridia bacterium]
MGNVFSFGWEDRLIIFIQQFMSGALVSVSGFITEFGDEIILIGILGLFYWSLNKELGKKLAVYLSFVNIINPCIKSVAKRLRPYMVNTDIKCLKPVNAEGDIYDVVSQEYSFPSGHAANCIAIYGTIAKNSRKKAWKAVLIVLMLLVGISRFALGVHYPTDVLAGWLISYAAIQLYRFIEKNIGRYKTYILLDIIGIAGFLIARTNDYYTGYGILLGSTMAIMFEEKYVHFEETRNVITVILRTVVGAGLFILLNTVLKLPFTKEFLNSGTPAAFAVRTVRYALIVFALVGLYPITFRWFGKKNGKNG